VSIEREVFPVLARERELLGYELKGYWTDIGKISDYLEANFSVLKMEARGEPIVQKGAKISPNAVLNSPCLVMKKATVADGAVLGPFAVVGEGSTIKEEANLERSVQFNNVCMEKSAKVIGSVIGDGVYLSHDVKLGDGTVIGAGAVIGPGVKLEGGVKVCAFKEINQSITGPMNICG
jgi:NDP-sugar pyrophosphorylase family protein